MIVPSFHNFAATPDAGASFVGGAGVGQRITEAKMQNQAAMAAIAQRASEASMQTGVAMQKLAQDQAQAEMMNQSRQAALQQEMLQKQQELEIQKAYQQSMIGLKQQEIANQKQVADAKIAMVAKQYASQQALVRKAQNLFATGQVDNLEEGWRIAALDEGLNAGFSGAEMAKFAEAGASGKNTMGPPVAKPVEGLKDYKYVPTGPNSYQYIKDAQVPEGVENVEGTGYVRIDGKVLPQRDTPEIKQLREDRKALKEELTGKSMLRHRFAMDKEKTKQPLSPADKIFISQYKEKERQLAEIDAKLNKIEGAGSRGSSTNRVRKYNLKTGSFD